MNLTVFTSLRNLSFIIAVISMLFQPFSAGTKVVAADESVPVLIGEQESLDTGFMTGSAESLPVTAGEQETSGANFMMGSALPPVTNALDYAAQVAYAAAGQQQVVESPHLEVDISPAIYIPGKPITLQWTIAGYEQADYAKSDMKVSIEASPGVTSTDTSLDRASSSDGLFTFPVLDVTGQTQWNVDASAVFPIAFNVQLSMDGKVIDEQQVMLDQAKLEVAAEGGVINSRDGQVEITVPSGALTQGLSFDVRPPSPQQMPSVSLTGSPVEIIAVNETTGENVKRFEQAIRVQMRYDPEKIFNGSEDSLTMYYYDEEFADWFPLPTTVDTVNKLIIAETDHLTVFDYKANNWQTNSLPTVDGFKVSDFTGAATYGLSFWMPPGPGGLQPALGLSYNSQVIDEASAFSQASWVGMGWSLETGSITRNMHGTDTNLDDDTFSVSMGGISGLLLPIGIAGNITTYNTADQSFAKVQFDSSANTWTVWSMDGMVYVFNHATKTNAGDGCEPAANLDLTWKWSLTTLTNLAGQSLSYTYFNEAKSATCYNQIAVYPETITYPNNTYRVRFERDTRTDYQESWTGSDARALYSTYRLARIVIEHNPLGTWNTIREYVFTYAPANSTTNVIYPRFKWSKGGQTLTLIGIQEKGGDGLAQPAVTFTYGDMMHVTEFNNGQGGKVTVAYERWHYFDDLNDRLRSLFTRFGIEECFSGAPDNKTWFSAPGSVGPVRCDGSGQPYLQIGDYVRNRTGHGRHSIPEHVTKPGARFRYAINLRSQSGIASATYGIIDTSTGQVQSLTNASITTNFGGVDSSFEMPVDYDPSQTQLMLDCDQCWVSKVQFAVMPSYWRVTARTITDLVTSNSTTYTYQYDNPASNSEETSEAVLAAGGNMNVLYTPALREYRGYAMTQVVNQENLATVNWYYQNDALKGRSYRSFVMGRSFYDDFETLNVANWANTSGVSIGSNDWDVYASLATTATNWPVSMTRNTASLTDGKVAIAHFRLTGATTQAEIGLLSQGNKFFGVIVQPEGTQYVARLRTDTGGGAQDTTILIPGGSFQPDKWYALMLFVDNNDGFKVRIWQMNNPAVAAETVVNGFTPDLWQFRARVNSVASGQTAILDLDAYTEGVPYSESDTTYAVTKQFDTTAGNAFPDIANGTLVSTYEDLAINWVYATESIQRNYHGDAAWSGTRTTYEYNTTDQNGAQYGNRTRTVSYEWKNGGWQGKLGIKVQFWPNANGTKYLVSLPARQVILDCASGCDFAGESGRLAETLYIYDTNSVYNSAPSIGFVTKQRTLADPVALNYIEQGFEYDLFGNLTKSIAYSNYATAGVSPAGPKFETTNTYETTYNTYLINTRNPKQQESKTTYDYNLGLPVSVEDANGVKTGAAYDGLGRMIRICAPLDGWDGITCAPANATLSITYYNYVSASSPFGVILGQKLDAGRTMIFAQYYSGLGQKLQTQTIDVSVGANRVNVFVTLQYDNLGRLVKQSTPNTYTGVIGFQAQMFTQFTGTTYDILGRATRVTSPDGNSVNTSYGELTITQTDAKNNPTTTTMDVWGRTISVAPPTGPWVTYAYDPLGRLKQATRGGVTTFLDYDLAGRKTGMSDPDMGLWFYTYDALGNLVRQTDARGQRICLYYDVLGRLTGKHYRSDDGCPASPTFNVTYTYDDATGGNYGIGRRTGMVDASGSTRWSYDARGRVTSEIKVISEHSYTTRTTYNSADLPVNVTYPDSEVVTNTYNSQMLLDSVSGTGNYVQSSAYDVAGRLTSRLLGNGLTQNYTYYDWYETANVDGLPVGQGGRLKSLTVGALQNLAYTYDAVGNIRQIVDAGASTAQTQSFGYDELDRLTSAQATGAFDQGGYTESYSYDAAGNLATKAGITLNYSASGHAHAVSYTSLYTVGPYSTYAYDANGNQITRNTPDGSYRLEYDAENRLVKVHVGRAIIAEFTYDGDGRQVKAVANGKTTIYASALYEDEFTTVNVPNNSFEASTDWTTTQTSPATWLWRSNWGEGGPHSGTYGYAITNNAYGNLTSAAIAITPETNYTVSVWLRGELDDQQGEGGWLVRAMYYNGSGTQVGFSDVTGGGGNSLTTAWQQVSGSVTVPAGAASMKLLLHSYQTSGWVAFDDVSVTLNGVGANLVPNPGFETTSDWTATQTSPATWLWRGSFGEGTPHSGSYSYVITNNAYGNLSSGHIIVNSKIGYTVSVWLRGELDDQQGEAGWLLRAVYYDSGEQLLSYSDLASGGETSLTTTWQQVSRSVTPPVNTASMKIQLYNYQSSGWVAFDDVSVTETNGHTNTNLVPNSGFETSSYWTTTQTSPATWLWRGSFGEGAPHSGSYSYVITNNTYGNLTSAAISNNITPNSEYRLSAWLRGELDDQQGEGAWQIRVVYYNSNGTQLGFTDTASGNGSSLTTAWQQVSGSFITPADTASLKIFLYNTQSSGWVAFDDIAIMKLTSVVKYYFAGAQRVALRENGALSYLLSDHLGSTSLVVNSAGVKTLEMRYTPWGEVRYAWSAAAGLPTDYTYTGQRSFMDDPTTGAAEGFGLMFYNARWYDPALGRFAQADTIIPPGVQGLDRYAYVNNSPMNYIDPSGHTCMDIDLDKYGKCPKNTVRNMVFEWNGGKYSGAMMRRLFAKYNRTKGWWNDYTTGIMTPKDFLTLILFFELGGVSRNSHIVEALKEAAVEKFNYWCAEASGGYCSGASDQAVFNYIATRGSAWKRYDHFVANNDPIPWNDGMPGNAEGSSSSLSNAGYQTISSITDAIYTGAKGKGSLWDWGNMEILRPGIENAPISPTDPHGVYSKTGTFYVLNADQANYWAYSVKPAIPITRYLTSVTHH